MKSELHQRGFLSVRHLFENLVIQIKICFMMIMESLTLKDGKQISITHSFTFSGVIISDDKVGIDIEKQRDKIAVIAKKFVDYEFNYLKFEY